GLSDDESDSYISAALKSADIAEEIGLSDLNDAFNFDEDGALADGDTAQTSNQTATTTAACDENYQVLVANASTEDATNNYTTRI
ncbi:flagellar protein, partial [Rhizobium ruizarguesonis]